MIRNIFSLKRDKISDTIEDLYKSLQFIIVYCDDIYNNTWKDTKLIKRKIVANEIDWFKKIIRFNVLIDSDWYEYK